MGLDVQESWRTLPEPWRERRELRFTQMLNLMLQDQLRDLTLASCEAYVGFLRRIMPAEAPNVRAIDDVQVTLAGDSPLETPVLAHVAPLLALELTLEEEEVVEPEPEARPSLIPSLCTHITSAGIGWRR